MKIPGGYILQPRCIDDSDFMHQAPVVRELWFYYLRKVNHADRNGMKRGQGFFTFHQISEDLSWGGANSPRRYHRKRIAKASQRLRERAMIETAKATRGIIVTICNYDYYQNPKNYESDTEKDTKAPQKRHKLTTKGDTIHKNVKNKEIVVSNNGNNNNNSFSFDQILPLFETLEHDRKTGLKPEELTRSFISYNATRSWKISNRKIEADALPSLAEKHYQDQEKKMPKQKNNSRIKF